METVESVISGLKLLADAGLKKGVERFGIPSEKALGIKTPELRKIAKSIKKNHTLALQLWQMDIHEAKVLASMVGDPKQMTTEQMDEWVADMYSWDVCDQCCGNLFVYTRFWKSKVAEWIPCKHEFTRRAGIVLIAEATMHQKNNVTDDELRSMLQKAVEVANDPRNFIKKAISWAMRQVGKKRPHLTVEVIELARKLQATDDKTCKWIASDVIRELEKRR
ncbi:MAG: DNA alkylation repair protein [Imperialibacter sp.]|uniref:DNA alkylation repair protein n=1 Tax=Imperialibacter sp. TaxID=2038411 RepID=UPI0030DCC9B0|tara:strand:+ start:416 stop:1078 length:663 start_codon:yes stop_codon:yes gene_type:complete